MSREAMQMALDMLNEIADDVYCDQKLEGVITAVRQALAQPEHEPVYAFRRKGLDDFCTCDKRRYDELAGKPNLFEVTVFYTAPPKKEWVGLTEEEIDALSQARSLTDELMDCVDRLGSEADTVDPRVWQHLLVYAPKPEEEPVAWMHTFIEGNVITHIPADIDRHPERWTPLYTAPPKQWVGLTDEEVQNLSYLSQKIDEGNSPWFDRWGFARAIEQALKEKNHG